MARDLPALRDRRHSRPRQSVVRHFAHAEDVSEQHAAQLISGNGKLWDRVEQFIYSCRATGKDAMLDRKMRPILKAYFAITLARATSASQALHEAAQADAAEDVARSDWQAGAITKADYLRRLNQEIARACALRDTLMGDVP